MRFRHHAPDPRLREFVQGLWEIEGLHLADPELNYDLPERTLRLMFVADRALQGPSADTLRPLPPVALTPFSLGAQRNVVQGTLRVLVAELYPWGARRLGWDANRPPDELNAALSASAWGREVTALVGLGEWDAAREALETHLRRLLTAGDGPGAGVLAARRIYDAFGAVRVADLAEELDLSPRTLERQFAREVGVGAKTLARVVRFDEANLRIRHDPQVPMSELSFELGFFDQAHLIREFKALSSLTPGAFAAIAARRRETFVLERFDHEDADWTRTGADSDFDFGIPPEPVPGPVGG